MHVLDYSLFLLGNPTVRAVSASTYDLLASAGFGSNVRSGKSGVTGAKTFDVEDLATVFMRLDDGGTLLVEASWAAHRRDGDEFGVTLYGTEGGAELIVDDYAPSGSLRVFTDEDGAPVARSLPRSRAAGTQPWSSSSWRRSARGASREHDGAGAAALARVVDACYRSAAEQREIRLSS